MEVMDLEIADDLTHISPKHLAQIYGLSYSVTIELLERGMIEGAFKKTRCWYIPVDVIPDRALLAEGRRRTKKKAAA